MRTHQTRAPAAGAPPAAGAVVVHQLDPSGICWREFTHYPRADRAADALYERIARGYLMTSTMVTRDGMRQLGAVGTHAAHSPRWRVPGGRRVTATGPLSVAEPLQRLYGDAALNAACRAYEAAGRAVAGHAQRIAAAMVRELLPTAHQLVFDKRDDDNGNCQITLAYVRDAAGALLWHGGDFAEHPDAVGLANVEAYGGPVRVRLDWRTVAAIEEALCDAYDAAAGFFPVSGEDAPGYLEPNLLEVAIPDALGLTDRIVTVDDPEALLAWLLTPDTRAEHRLDERWRPTAAAVAALVQDVADNSPGPGTDEWAVHPPATRVFARPAAGGVVLFGAELAGFGEVSTAPQDDTQLAAGHYRTGPAAAVAALQHVAALLNAAYRDR